MELKDIACSHRLKWWTTQGSIEALNARFVQNLFHNVFHVFTETLLKLVYTPYCYQMQLVVDYNARTYSGTSPTWGKPACRCRRGSMSVAPLLSIRGIHCCDDYTIGRGAHYEGFHCISHITNILGTGVQQRILTFFFYPWPTLFFGS